jgi:hypothetical protein
MLDKFYLAFCNAESDVEGIWVSPNPEPAGVRSLLPLQPRPMRRGPGSTAQLMRESLNMVSAESS